MNTINIPGIILTIVLVIVFVCSLAACGNMSLGIGNFEFNGAHISDYAGNSVDVSIEKWYENSTGIELLLENGNSVFLSEGTYILYEDHCPICEAK